MATSGKFSAQLNDIEKLLNDLDLLEERNHYPNLIANPGSTFRKLNYPDSWLLSYRSLMYNFVLKDSSLVLFKPDGYPSFSFLGCPYDCLSYRDFLVENGFEYNEVGNELLESYAEYLLQCDVSEAIHLFRFDYAPGDYNEGSHPASHFHIGYKNDVRLGLKKILDPIAFILFVVRHHYPNYWRVLLGKGQYSKMIQSHRVVLQDIDEKRHYKNLDKIEFYLL